MARARGIKPGFFKNEVLSQLPCYARLLFIGLWTLADRAGRLEDRPMRIRVEIFPYEEVDVGDMLRILDEAGFIRRYEVAGNRLISIVNFTKHQHPHVNEVPSTIPAPEQHQSALVLARPLTDSLLLTPDSLPRLHASAPVPAPEQHQSFEFTETEPAYWKERLYTRHPKKRDLTLVEHECVRLWIQKNGDALEFFREIDRVHELWCKSDGWLKENGRYAPKLAEWLCDRGWSKVPESEDLL